MATLLKSWEGNTAGGGGASFYVRLRLYRDSDSGTGWYVHWEMDTYFVNAPSVWCATFTEHFAAAGDTTFYKDPAAYTNTAMGHRSVNPFFIAYGQGFSTGSEVWSRYTGGSGTTYTSTIAAVSHTVPRPTYTVAYNANGGSGAPASQTKTYGYSLTLSSTAPTRSGWRFDGWATSASGPVAYQPGGTYAANAAVTLYARWTALYAVTYSANGGTGTTASQTKVHGVALTLRANGFARPGFSFKRWNTSADDGGTAYAAGGSYTGNAALALHAVWSRTVSFDLNGGPGAAPSALTSVATSAIALPQAPAREGFSQAGWGTAADGSGTAYAAGGSYPANLPTATLHALWSRTVSFDANGGSGAPQAVSSLATAALALPSAVPARQGWGFLRWDTEADGTGTAHQPGGTYAEGLASATLHAVWGRRVTQVAVASAEAVRVASAGSSEEDDEGTFARVAVSYVVRGAAAASVALAATCSWEDADGNVRAKDCSVTSGATAAKAEGSDLAGEAVVTASGCDTDVRYAFAVTVTAANSSAEQEPVAAARAVALQPAYYTLDVLAGGHGISFGAPARGRWHNVSMERTAFEQPDLPVMTFATRAVAEATLGTSVVTQQCLVLCLDDLSLWHYRP